MRLSKKILLVAFLMFLAASCNRQSTKITAPPSPSYNYSHGLQIGAQTLNVEIATSTAAMEQGLSDRTSMAQNQGMLFDFGTGASSYPSFWMKDMDFNLDFIWINQNKIVGITPNVPAPTASCRQSTSSCQLPYYYPPSPVDEVLEVNAGWVEKNNVKVGNTTQLK